MVKLGDASCREARADVCLDAQVGANLVRRTDGWREIHAEMTVIRVAQRRYDEEVLPYLPTIHDVSAVIIQGSFINIASIGSLVRIGRIHRIRESVYARLLAWCLPRHCNARTLTAFIMIFRTDGHIMLVMRHQSDRRLQDIVLAIEIIKIEMTIRYSFAENMIIYVRVMFGLIEAHAIVCKACLLLPVNAEIVAPRIF